MITADALGARDRVKHVKLMAEVNRLQIELNTAHTMLNAAKPLCDAVFTAIVAGELKPDLAAWFAPLVDKYIQARG